MKTSKALTLIIAWTLIATSLILLVPAAAETGSRSAADVTVTDIRFSQAVFFVGDTITVTATIDNLGTENATAVTVSFEAGNLTLPPIDLGTNASIGTDNGGTDIAYGDPINVSVVWNTSEVSKEVQTGKIYSINVTATNTTDDNTTNDIMKVEIEFLDEYYLDINEVTPSAMSVMRGDQLNVSWNVTNIGSQAQPALGDTLYLFQDNETIAIDSAAIMNLDPKEYKTGTFNVDTSGLSIGNHTYTLELFDAQRNVTTDNITITFPNVYVGEMTWVVIGSNATNATVGDIVTVNATIHNNGTADAIDVYVGFFVDGHPAEVYNDTVNVTVDGFNVSTFAWNTTGLTAVNHTVSASLKPVWVSENSTGNITFEAGGVADLTITDLAIDPTIVDIGDIVNITTTIKNIGDWPSEATNVSFRVVKGLNSTNLGLTDIGPLEPGQSTSTYHLWNTSGLEFWNYQIWVQADPEGYVYEEALINNKANVSLVLNAKPDLTVEGINMTVSQEELTNISQGESATINIIVKNIGTKNSETTRAAIYLDGGATPVETLKIFGLAVNGFYVLQYIWDTTSASVGNHTFRVVVDIDDNNTEILEDNNELEFEVKVLEPKGIADLMVDSISINPANPKIGDHVEITTTVKNLGTADAVNATLLFAYQAPGGNIEIGKEVIPLVAVGQEVIKSAIWTTGILRFGNYTLNISVDPLNEIRESDTLNNFKTLDLNLIPTGAAAGTPDLKVHSITMSKEKPKEGDLIKITVTILNNGDGDASQVKVILYIDDIEEGTKSITTLAKNGATATVEFEWKAKKGMHELKAEVYIGTSAVKDDQSSEVVTIKSIEEGASGDYMIILLVIIVIVIIAIILMVAGGKGSKDKKGFVEEDHDDEEEGDADEEE